MSAADWDPAAYGRDRAQRGGRRLRFLRGVDRGVAAGVALSLDAHLFRLAGSVPGATSTHLLLLSAGYGQRARKRRAGSDWAAFASRLRSALVRAGERIHLLQPGASWLAAIRRVGDCSRTLPA